MPSDRVYVRSMPPALMTAEELLQTSIPDKHVELVRGVLVVREPAGYRHGRVSRLGHRPRAPRRSCVPTGWDRDALGGDRHARRRGRAPGLLVQSHVNLVGTLN